MKNLLMSLLFFAHFACIGLDPIASEQSNQEQVRLFAEQLYSATSHMAICDPQAPVAALVVRLKNNPEVQDIIVQAEATGIKKWVLVSEAHEIAQKNEGDEAVTTKTLISTRNQDWHYWFDTYKSYIIATGTGLALTLIAYYAKNRLWRIKLPDNNPITSPHAKKTPPPVPSIIGRPKLSSYDNTANQPEDTGAGVGTYLLNNSGTQETNPPTKSNRNRPTNFATLGFGTATNHSTNSLSNHGQGFSASGSGFQGKTNSTYLPDVTLTDVLPQLSIVNKESTITTQPSTKPTDGDFSHQLLAEEAASQNASSSQPQVQQGQGKHSGWTPPPTDTPPALPTQPNTGRPLPQAPINTRQPADGDFSLGALHQLLAEEAASENASSSQPQVQHGQDQSSTAQPLPHTPVQTTATSKLESASDEKRQQRSFETTRDALFEKIGVVTNTQTVQRTVEKGQQELNEINERHEELKNRPEEDWYTRSMIEEQQRILNQPTTSSPTSTPQHATTTTQGSPQTCTTPESKKLTSSLTRSYTELSPEEKQHRNNQNNELKQQMRKAQRQKNDATPPHNENAQHLLEGLTAQREKLNGPKTMDESWNG